jgi:hypothetical protein
MDVPIFESNMVSIVLAWVCVTPMLGYLAFAPFALIADFDVSRWHRALFVWLLLCLVVLSPLRYAIFQLALFVSFPVQGLRAFFTGILALCYLPIVLGILYALSIGIPLGGTALIAGMEYDSARWRVIPAALVAPVLCIGAWLSFTALLPLAAGTVRWLDPVALVRATNGPSYYIFKYVAMPGTPLQFPFPGDEASQFGLSERDLEICAAIGPLLKEKGQVFVGIDVIGDYLTEINVTSPTGLQELERFDATNGAGLIWDAIEARRA